ncbi:MAG: protein-L-isoaspartate(D-aspartate) O-methyltransferase [Betaproteobacteria bacterium]|nr:protein-L-isoaspartate(D-aspartate) O-methyltransferase [Betaproteobacteria bacterium]
MIEEIAAMTRDSRLDIGRSELAAPVMAAMARVPRHEFIPANIRRNAYVNRPQSIGAGQTISQPFIVALMSDLMNIKPGHKVLEIGTGSGYQAAVLAEMGAVVYTIEIVESLAKEAQARLQRLGYTGIRARSGDGYQGWPEQAPFDAIMLTAAPREVPRPLTDQLKPGGRLIAPIGESGGAQSLLLIERRPDGSLARRDVLAVRFVPLTDTSGKQR